MPKISELNPITSMSMDDLVPVVNDPNGAPSNNKITFDNFANSVVGYISSRGVVTGYTGSVGPIGPTGPSGSSSSTDTGNIVFSDTTISTRHENEDLILTSQNGNVSIETAGNMKFNFNTGIMTITSSEYGDEMYIGQGMGPSIIANSSLFQYSYYANTETNENWDHGNLMYPGTHQIWTEYSNNEVGLSRNSSLNLSSDINNIYAEVSLIDGANNYVWSFGSDGKLTVPSTISNAVSPLMTLDSLEIDLTKTVIKLTATDNSQFPTAYHLADGYEGQIIYLVPGGGSRGSEYTGVNIDNYRISAAGDVVEAASGNYWLPFARTQGTEQTIGSAIITLIFTDGHWNLPHNWFD